MIIQDRVVGQGLKSGFVINILDHASPLLRKAIDELPGFASLVQYRIGLRSKKVAQREYMSGQVLGVRSGVSKDKVSFKERKGVTKLSGRIFNLYERGYTSRGGRKISPRPILRPVADQVQREARQIAQRAAEEWTEWL